MSNPPPTPESTATIMDRFSDWLGSLVVGCSRLPSRHPVKVSLVMGLLGLASAWIASSSIQLVELNFETRMMGIGGYYSIGIGALIGIVVIAPAGIWRGWSLVSNGVAILLSVAITRFIDLAWWLDHLEPHPTQNLPMMQAQAIRDLSVWIVIHVVIWFGWKRCLSLPTLTTIACCLMSFILTCVLLLAFRESALTYFSSSFSDWIHQSWYLSSLTVPLAICFGSSIWDRNPFVVSRSTNR